MTLKEICNIIKRIEEQKQLTYICPKCGETGILLLDQENGICLSCKSKLEAHIIITIKIFIENIKKKHMN